MTEFTERQKASFRALLDSDDVLILVHRSADGDCLGTAYALLRALEMRGKRGCVAASGAIDRNLRFLTGGKEELRPRIFPSTVVAVDVATKSMLGADLAQYEDLVDYCIDHHVTNPGFGRVENVIVPQASSAGEVLFDLFDACGMEINDAVAENLYAAIAFDTGCFRYSNTSAHTHEVAARLLKYSFDAPEIVRQMFDIVPLNQLRTEYAAVSATHLELNGKVALLPITRRLLKDNGATDEDVSGIVSVVRRIEGVLISASLRETKEGDIRVSLRTSDPAADVSRIAGEFGGGGHVKASGCLMKMTMEEAESALLDAIRRELLRVHPEGIENL